MPNSRILRNSWNFLKIALNSERISLTTLTYFSAQQQQNTLQRSYHGPRPGFLYSTRSIDAMFVWLIDMERLTFEIRKVVVY
jgi:hypothetical protein